MSKWLNDDGLPVRFGMSQAAIKAEGVPSTAGEIQELVINIVATDIPDTDDSSASEAALFTVAGLPQKAQLLSAEIYVSVAFTSAGSPTLDVGLWHNDGDGTYTVSTQDGFLVDEALTSLDSIGAEVICGGAYVDGTDDVVPNDAAGRDMVVCLGYQTSDKYTAGKAKLIIKYIKVV